jgi:hypothetical protein
LRELCVLFSKFKYATYFIEICYYSISYPFLFKFTIGSERFTCKSYIFHSEFENIYIYMNGGEREMKKITFMYFITLRVK